MNNKQTHLNIDVSNHPEERSRPSRSNALVNFLPSSCYGNTMLTHFNHYLSLITMYTKNVYLLSQHECSAHFENWVLCLNLLRLASALPVWNQLWHAPVELQLELEPGVS